MSQQPQPPVQKKESVRQWYHRTTSGARKFLLMFSAVAVAAAVVLFICAPQSLHQSLQQFNGAYVIPVAGGIWILGFLYIFLIPQREVGFRSQEFIESMSNSVKDTIEREIVPAVTLWKRVGEKIEAELPGMITQVKDGMKQATATMEDLRAAAKRLNDAVDMNGKIVEDTKPAIEALKRIEAKVEVAIRGGLFEKVDTALDSVRSLGGLPPKEEEEQPNMDWALESIRRNKAKTGAKQ